MERIVESEASLGNFRKPVSQKKERQAGRRVGKEKSFGVVLKHLLRQGRGRHIAVNLRLVCITTQPVRVIY